MARRCGASDVDQLSIRTAALQHDSNDGDCRAQS
jgi:hypothetical protein